MRNPLLRTTERYLTEQFLARIGYASGLEQQSPEPDPNLRSDIRLATIEEVQAKILDQLQEHYPSQRETPFTISSRPGTQIRRPDLREDAWSPSILPETPSTISRSGKETSYLPLKPGHENISPLSPMDPRVPAKAQILAGLHSELERREKICLRIERQLKPCQKRIRTHPSKQKKNGKERDERIAKFYLKPVRYEDQGMIDAEKRKDAKTAEGAEMEERRNIYLQYDRELCGVPTAESVDAFFVIIANTEHHIKKTEEANKVERRRGEKLEEKLYKARCAMFEMEDDIVQVESGAVVKEAREPEVEKSRIGGRKRRPRRGKGAKKR